jgi:hypothetical protein
MSTRFRKLNRDFYFTLTQQTQPRFTIPFSGTTLNLNIGLLKKRLSLYYQIVIHFMAKKIKQPTQKSARKALLKEIQIKLADTVKPYHKKISDKKLEKRILKAGKILSKSLTREQITVAHKEKTRTPKKDKKVAEKENVS